jgi:hypothetical protein
MPNKSIIFAGILILGAAVTLLIDKNNLPEKTQIIDTPLIEDNEKSLVTKIDINANQNTISLSAKDNYWTITSNNDFPANGRAILAFLDQLKTTKVIRLLSSKESEWTDFGIEKANKIVLTMKEGPQRTFWLGNARSGGGQYIGLEKGDQKMAVMISQGIGFNPNPVNWEIKSLVTIDKDDIKKVTFAAEEGDKQAGFAVMRESREAPFTTQQMPANMEVNPERINQLASLVASFDYTDKQEKTEKLEGKKVTGKSVLKIDTFSDREYSLIFERFENRRRKGRKGKKDKQQTTEVPEYYAQVALIKPTSGPEHEAINVKMSPYMFKVDPNRVKAFMVDDSAFLKAKQKEEEKNKG